MGRGVFDEASFERVVRVLREEIGDVGLRQLGAGLVSRVLPQLSFARCRTAALRALGVRLGPRSVVLGPLRITGKGDVRRLLSFGADVVVTGPLHVDIGGEVRIGDRVYIGHDAALITVDHRIGSSERRCAETKLESIVIGDGAWLAARVIVLPGVTIGAGAVVAAGAVVTRDVEPNVLVGGVPARVLRKLDAEKQSESHSRAKLAERTG
ncbi:MAG TPA: acyltransferase [Polyangiaceae bacterium]|nr:acyltransferase [Polyangiaceae bacterium]